MNKSVYDSPVVDADINRHILTILVDNEPGVLARVVGMFSGRGYNIDSLNVAEVNNQNLSRTQGSFQIAISPQILVRESHANRCLARRNAVR